MKTKALLYGLILPIAMVQFHCASSPPRIIKLYSEPELQKGEICILLSEPPFHVQSIDGKSIDGGTEFIEHGYDKNWKKTELPKFLFYSGPHRFELLPGPHLVTVVFFKRFMGNVSQRLDKIDFFSEPGHTYHFVRRDNVPTDFLLPTQIEDITKASRALVSRSWLPTVYDIDWLHEYLDTGGGNFMKAIESIAWLSETSHIGLLVRAEKLGNSLMEGTKKDDIQSYHFKEFPAVPILVDTKKSAGPENKSGWQIMGNFVIKRPIWAKLAALVDIYNSSREWEEIARRGLDLRVIEELGVPEALIDSTSKYRDIKVDNSLILLMGQDQIEYFDSLGRHLIWTKRRSETEPVTFICWLPIPIRKGNDTIIYGLPFNKRGELVEQAYIAKDGTLKTH